ncbi:MAG: GntR family transcriptional regulator [Jatrophihabitantaceae bacterium]
MATPEPHASADAAVLPRLGNGSLTDRTTNMLLEAILARKFPNNRLPAEPELAEQLGVSRTTIRAALQSLERLGVLSRAPGRGTIVRAHVGRESIVLQRLIGFKSLLLERHKNVEVKQRYWVHQGASAEANQILGVPLDSVMVVSAKTFLADKHPAIYIADQIPLAYCAPSLQESLLGGADVPLQDSIFEFSRSWPGREIDHTVVEMIPSVAPATGTTLRIPAGRPYMQLLESHYTSIGEAVALSSVHVDDAYVRFQVVRHT